MAGNKKIKKKKAKKSAAEAGSVSVSFHSPAMTAINDNGNSSAALEKERAHPCFNCQHCCTYVATEVGEPESNKEYDEILWFLYHRNVCIFIDWDEDWYIQFNTPCDKLTPTGLCSVYEERPFICADYDWQECERNFDGDPAHRWFFHTADEFVVWFERERPKDFKKWAKYKKKQAKKRQDEQKKKGKKDPLFKVKNTGVAAR